MKALVTTSYGTPERFRLTEVPIPRPGPGEVQVRVDAAALNPADLLITEGTLRDLVPLEFPYVLGTDFAGTVTELGPEVNGFAVGQQIFGFGAPPAFAAGVGISAVTSGAMAEYALFRAGPYLAARPENLSPPVAAALPSIGMTGLAVRDAGRFQPGERVLVIGATGGIGSVLVPLLAMDKVEVLATAPAADRDHLLRLGAADAIDYLAADTVEETLRRHPGGVDGVVNLALAGAPLLRAGRVLRPGGRLLSTTPGTPDQAAFGRDDLTVTVVMGTTELRPDTLTTIAAHVADGGIPDPIGSRFRFADAVRAYRDLASGAHTRGKSVVLMD